MSTLSTEDLYEGPWRPTVNWQDLFTVLAALKDEIENYEPLMEMTGGMAQFPHVNILLLGSVGVGKTSIYNTINSLFRGKIFNVGRVGNSKESVTTKITRYSVMSGINLPPTPLRFRLVDMGGLSADHLMTKENMRYLLEGNLPNKQPFKPNEDYSYDMPGFIKNPRLEDKIHCVAIVQDATKAEDFDPAVVNNIKEMQTVMNSLDIPQIIVLTKIDEICAETKRDISCAFRSPRVEKCVAKVSDTFGLPKNQVFPMKNYENEVNLDTGIDVMALLTLKGILNQCDAKLFSFYDDIMENYQTT